MGTDIISILYHIPNGKQQPYCSQCAEVSGGMTMPEVFMVALKMIWNERSIYLAKLSKKEISRQNFLKYKSHLHGISHKKNSDGGISIY